MSVSPLELHHPILTADGQPATLTLAREKGPSQRLPADLAITQIRLPLQAPPYR